MIFFWVPETKVGISSLVPSVPSSLLSSFVRFPKSSSANSGSYQQRTLEELDYIFAVPTRRFMSYQTGTWLPWFIKRYIFWKKDAELKALDTFDNGLMRDIEDQKRDAEREMVASVSRAEESKV